MYAHRIRITVPESREITLRLPDEVPIGEAELIVLTEFPAARESAERFKTWLDAWIRTLPDSPAVPLAALRREELHE